MIRCACLTVSITLVASAALAQQTGAVSGTIRFEGVMPAKVAAAKPGAAAMCGVLAVEDDSLLVDPATGGIANVFIYLKKAPAAMPAAARAVPKKPVVFDQKQCRFVPHAVFIRAGQPVELKSKDACIHNVNTFPLKNTAVNVIVPPNPPKTFLPAAGTAKAELLPIQVKCGVHPWMKSYWLILDHPYAAVSAKDGSFTISGLPPGNHSFRVWHERAGYLERVLNVAVQPGKTTAVPANVTTYGPKDF